MRESSSPLRRPVRLSWLLTLAPVTPSSTRLPGISPSWPSITWMHLPQLLVPRTGSHLPSSLTLSSSRRLPGFWMPSTRRLFLSRVMLPPRTTLPPSRSEKQKRVCNLRISAKTQEPSGFPKGEPGGFSAFW